MAGYATGSPLAVSVHVKPRESSLAICKRLLRMINRMTYYLLGNCDELVYSEGSLGIVKCSCVTISRFFLIYVVSIYILHGYVTILPDVEIF